MWDRLKKAVSINEEEIKKRQEYIGKLNEKFEPARKVVRRMYDIYVDSLKVVLMEQDLVEDEWIIKGYSYSSTFHTLSFMTQMIEGEDVIDKLYEFDFFGHILNSYEEIEESTYVREVFESFKREELTHHIPFLILLVERLMRILTGNLDTYSYPGNIKKIINESMIEYEKENLEELTENEREEVSQIKTKINKNTKSLLLKSYNNIVFKGLFNDERSAKGNILNRHRVLHGKQDFDEMTEEDLVKLGFVILLFIDLIKLKRTGVLTIVNRQKI